MSREKISDLKRYSYLYEIPLFYLVLCGINFYLVPEYPSFFGIDPHPYWLGIVLFAFRYGLVPSLISGVLSALLFLFGIFLFGERYLFEDAVFFLLPSFFIIVSTCLGFLTRQTHKKIIQFQDAEISASQKEKHLNEEIKTLTEINNNLEKRIVTRMSTLVTLYEGARRLETHDIEELYKSGLDFITKTLGADEAAIYLKQNNEWHLKESIGWKEYEKHPKILKWSEGLTGLAGSTNKIVSIRDFMGHSPKELPNIFSDALVAAPLRLGEHGKVIGVIAIQRMPFLSFTSSSVNLFSFLMNWISRSVGEASYIQELKEQEIIDPELQVYSHSYFLSRARQEFLRSKNYYLPLGLGVVSFDQTTPLSAKENKRLLLAIAQLLKQNIREMDVVARFPSSEHPFSILFITASPKQTEEMTEKITHAYQELKLVDAKGKPLPLIKIKLSHFSPQVADIDQMLREALI